MATRRKLIESLKQRSNMPASLIRPLIFCALVSLTSDAALVDAQQAQAVAPLTIPEWKVPWANTRPRDPYVAADGKVWFVGQAGNYIANLDPASGKFRRFEIEEGTHPHNLIIAKQGRVWFSGNTNARIGWLDEATGRRPIYHLPEPAR